MNNRYLGLYIHIPYCIHKCGYCDFNSHLIKHDEMDTYVNALIKELNHYAKIYSPKNTIDTIFLGGGTPTTLSIPQLETILKECEKRFKITTNAEITIEANPASILKGQLKSIRKLGYNRISIGVQSFDKKELQVLDRAHKVEEIHHTIDEARKAGFNNLSLDLMFAIPQQTISNWNKNLNQAIDKNPEHLSTYNLTIEKGTAFWKMESTGKLTMPSDDHQLALYKQTIELLKNNGFQHYEISNFALPGKECNHNIAYWKNKNTLGLGAGASSYLDGIRTKNTAIPYNYIKNVLDNQVSVESQESLEPRRAMGEAMMLGLRLIKGINIRNFEERFQVPLKVAFGNVIESLRKKDLIVLEKDQLRLSEKGLFLADSVILEFI